MKFRVLPSALAAMMGLSLGGASAQAQQAGSHVFNAQQRGAIVDVVRQALKDDPSILVDAMQSLRQKSMERQQAQNLVGVRANWQALSTAPSYSVRGNPAGSVTVVEFLDPRCGYCRRMAPLVDAFIARHPDVRLVEKVVPVLGPASVLASRAIYAAALQGHYDGMRRAVMEETSKPDENALKDMARQQGLNVAKFMQDLSNPAVAGLITTNLGQAQAVGLDGTPTFVFGQAAVAPGAMSAEQMDRLFDAAKGR